MTLDAMSKLYADKAFLSCDGFHHDHGFTVEHDFSTTIKRAYIANSRQSVMMLDSSKLGRTSFYRFSTMDDFDYVITDEDPEGYLVKSVDRSKHALLVIASLTHGAPPAETLAAVPDRRHSEGFVRTCCQSAPCGAKMRQRDEKRWACAAVPTLSRG